MVCAEVYGMNSAVRVVCGPWCELSRHWAHTTNGNTGDHPDRWTHSAGRKTRITTGRCTMDPTSCSLWCAEVHGVMWVAVFCVSFVIRGVSSAVRRLNSMVCGVSFAVRDECFLSVVGVQRPWCEFCCPWYWLVCLPLAEVIWFTL